MRLVLEHQDPVLRLAVHVHGDAHGAGVDLLALVQVRQQARGLERLGADGRDVHERHGLALTAEDLAQLEVAVIGVKNRRMVDVRAVDLRKEGGVAAVVRPIGVDHADLGDGGVALLLVAEVGLAEGDVVLVHGQTVVAHKGRKTRRIQGRKARERLHRGGDVVVHLQRRRAVEGGLARLDRVDQRAADGGHLLVRDLAVKEIDLGRAHGGPLAAGLELDALGGGVRALVELAGQVLDGQGPFALCAGRQVLVGVVQLRLGEHVAHRRGELGVGQALDVVAVEDAHAAQGRNALHASQIAEHRAGLHRVLGPLFHVDAVNRHRLRLPFCRCRGGGVRPRSGWWIRRGRPRPRPRSASGPGP